MPRSRRNTSWWKNRPEYNSWSAMKSRCSDPNVKSYHRYGGRGIRVCPEWEGSFAEFFNYVGPRPTPDHTLGRIDNDAGYYPGNVEWQTRSEQANNRSSNVLVNFRGEVMTMTQFAAKSGLSYGKARYYISHPESQLDDELVSTHV